MREFGKEHTVKDAFLGLLSFVAHVVAALWITTLLSVLLTAIAAGLLKSSLRDSLAWFLVGIVGLILGYIANRAVLQRSACWVWIPGLIFLGFAIWDTVRRYDARWYQGCSATETVVNSFLVADSSKCGGGGPTLAVLFFTTPAFSSITYSLGARSALIVSRRKNNVSQPVRSSEG